MSQQPNKFPEKMQPLFEPHRFKVFYGGRGAGRSWGFARALLMLGISTPLRVLCAREYQNSIKESVHKVIADQIRAMGYDNIYKVLEASIVGPEFADHPNGFRTEFNFEGIKQNPTKIKSYEGIDICWVEEANKVSKASWENLVPTIRKDSPLGPFQKGSEIWMSFNPELETDYTYQEYVLNPQEDSVVVHMTWRDNPWFPEVLRKEMETMKSRDPDAYLNIWEGQCRQVLDGAVYANELREAAKDHRLTNVSYDHTKPVDTFWDLGWADMTSIWFAQQVGFEYHIIDYYQNSLKKLDHYLGILQQRGYIYGTTWLPHDAAAHEKGSGRSIEELARAKGFNVRLVPKLSLSDGINAARTIFPNCYFDSRKCSDGIQGLRHYRYEVNEVTIPRGRDNFERVKELSQKPIHDWSSHPADAFRYLAIALRSPQRKGGFTERLLRQRVLSKGPMELADGEQSGLGWLK